MRHSVQRVALLTVVQRELNSPEVWYARVGEVMRADNTSSTDTHSGACSPIDRDIEIGVYVRTLKRAGYY